MAKTLAIRLSDELHARAAAVAQLTNVSLTELIRSAIEAHLQAKAESGELAAQAEAVLAEIDSEAETRRKAIQGLLGGETAPPAKGSGRGRRTPPEAS